MNKSNSQIFKKFYFLLIGIISLISFSCSNKEFDLPVSNEITSINFKVEIPSEFYTHTYGDASAANQLQILVYDVDEGNSHQFSFKTVTNFGSDGKANVNLDLVSGKAYKIIFFASSDLALGYSSDESISTVYSIDNNSGVLSVNYSAMTSEGNLNDAYDCFYQIYKTEKLNTSFSASIILNRPVAQINWATDDLEEIKDIYGETGQKLLSSLVFKPYKTLNLLTGEISDKEEMEINMQFFGKPSNLTFTSGSATYDVIALQYILCPSTENKVDLNLKIKSSENDDLAISSKTIEMKDAPVQANFQTFIYGTLLSDKSPDIKVIIGAKWNYSGGTADLE